jgi:RHS repeat-associated protein
MQAITYPDGETVRYGYDYGGNVVSVAGTKQGQAFPYVDKIGYDEWGQRVYLKLGNGVETTYAYNEDRRWLSRVLTESAGQAGKPVLQDIQYKFDLAGNVSSYENKAGTYTTAQEYAYDGLYQLVYARGISVNKPHGDFDYQAEYTQTYQFDSLGLGNMTEKRSWTANTDPRRLGDPLDYEQDYAYAAGFAHRAERIGRRHYRYDLNGNVATEQDGPFSTVVSTGGHTITELENGTRVVDNGWGMNDNGVTAPAPKVWKREYAWNERNLLRTSRDDQHIVEYTYGQDGERSGKYSMTADGGHRHETLYFNKMWTWHYDGLLNEFTGRNSKHVYLGESRIVTKISRADNGGSTAEERIKQYYYHSDHLGSAQVISNADGQEYERIEYTPYGELWIEKASTASNIDIPYRFTGKERDEETGLYYYGARYLDSKASRWLSTDPALGDYIPGTPVDDAARKRNQSLPGMGGVFNLVNLHLYHYAGNNPVKYIDPDGKAPRSSISFFFNPFQSNYDENPIKQFGNAGWQLLGILNLFIPQSTFDNRGMATASVSAGRAGILTSLVQNTKIAITSIGLFMSLAVPRDPSFRKNLADRTGNNPDNYDAHHNLPVKLHEYFTKAKINYQNSKFGSWVERNMHQGMNKEFQSDWEAFAEQNPDSSPIKIIDFARDLAKKYGVDTDF